MKLSLDKRYKRNDGSYSIVFRVTYLGESRDISSGFTCKKEEWDSRYDCVRVTNPKLKLLSERLNEQRLKYQEKLLEFERKFLDSNTTAQTIKQYLNGKQSSPSTLEKYWLDQIDQLKEAKRHGNARNYKSALLGLRKVADLKIPFTKVDYSWIVKVDSRLRARGMKQSSISVYMRTLRALYNKAINEEMTSSENYPFKKYQIKSGKTTPRVASIDELRRYFNLNVPAESHLFNHWNYGKLIFMLRGINFSDLALLTSSNIKQDRIVYRRNKTHKLYSVQILPEVQRLIDLYTDPERQALFPIMSNDELKQESIHPKRLGQLRKTTNKWFKKLGAKANIAEPLSTYVFRYSYANACKKLGFTKDLIAEALGHEYGNTITGIYLEQFDLDVVDDMNRMVCNEVSGL